MRLRAALVSLASLVLLPIFAAAAMQDRPAPQFKRSTLVKIETHAEIKATPARVWQALTSAEGFSALAGFQGAEAGKPLAKVGDAASAAIWGDKGMLVCTFAGKEKELRVHFEPENGTYLCQKRITLEAAGGGTRLTVLDRYSDDQTDTIDKTAKQVMDEMNVQIAAFRAVAE